ncbi:hypothetical protein DK926_12745 [Rhodococcus sp. Eu-32]|uniref:hypothetical protein n=1 Tax=Rhodococcus sp. Eu-32 TaxID=1017319 RepID=UPI000DF1861F|nr:hypothetical protein [Rhodococcus sp. Eu-32]RRQ27359.1 hypothetical protein DK926_12745 [Rhodococcus sp. Eu-32]
MTEPGVTRWQALANAADNGQLYLNPDAAVSCSRACDEFLEKLVAHQAAARLLADVNGLGEFESGRALRVRFAQKAMGGANNLVDVLQSHIDVVTEMQIVFKKFFADTTAVDTRNSMAIDQNGPN